MSIFSQTCCKQLVTSTTDYMKAVCVYNNKMNTGQ